MIVDDNSIKWIEDATEPARTFRRMVVGWKVVLNALNASILFVNDHFFDSLLPAGIPPTLDLQHFTRLRLVVGAIVEVKDRLDAWHNDLYRRGLIDAAAEQARQDSKNELRPIETLRDIRNLTFHYGDFVESTDQLLVIYRDIRQLTFDQLNRIVRALITRGSEYARIALANAGD